MSGIGRRAALLLGVGLALLAGCRRSGPGALPRSDAGAVAVAQAAPIDAALAPPAARPPIPVALAPAIDVTGGGDVLEAAADQELRTILARSTDLVVVPPGAPEVLTVEPTIRSMAELPPPQPGVAILRGRVTLGVRRGADLLVMLASTSTFNLGRDVSPAEQASGRHQIIAASIESLEAALVGVLHDPPSHTVPWPEPTVSLGPPRAGGAALAEQGLLTPVRPRLVACYLAALDLHAGLAGRIDVSLLVGAGGGVQQARARGVDPTLAACVAASFKRFAFPQVAPPDGGTATVETSVELAPAAPRRPD